MTSLEAILFEAERIALCEINVPPTVEHLRAQHLRIVELENQLRESASKLSRHFEESAS